MNFTNYFFFIFIAEFQFSFKCTKGASNFSKAFSSLKICELIFKWFISVESLLPVDTYPVFL